MLKQDKQILVLAVIIAVLAIIIGLIFFMPWKFLLNRPVSQEVLAAQRTAEVKLYDLALAENNVNLCAGIKDISTRDSCYEKLARNLQDKMLCQNIQDQWLKDYCFYNVIIDKAFSQKSLEPCNELASPADIDKCKKTMQDTNFCRDESCPRPANQ